MAKLWLETDVFEVPRICKCVTENLRKNEPLQSCQTCLGAGVITVKMQGRVEVDYEHDPYDGVTLQLKDTWSHSVTTNHGEVGAKALADMLIQDYKDKTLPADLMSLFSEVTE